MSGCSNVEEQLLKAVAAGNWLEYPSIDPEFVISAEFLRKLLLRVPVRSGILGGGKPSPIAPPGIRVRQAIIEGDLDLSDASDVDGQALPSLALENCRLTGAVSLDHARIDRLSLRGSRLARLTARGAIIGGVVDLTGVAPLDEGGDAQCWVDFCGTRVERDLLMGDATFRAPPPRESRDPTVMSHYAMHAMGAEVGGAVFAMNVRAYGGISFKDAVIRGESWFSGAELHAGETHAFNGQSARFGSALMFRKLADDRPTRAQGKIWLLNAKVAGACDFSGGEYSGINVTESTIEGRFSTLGATLNRDDTGACLMAEEAVISDMDLSRFENKSTMNGMIVLAGIDVRCNLRLGGVTLDARDKSTNWVMAIALEGATIGGMVEITRATIHGWLNGRRSRIGGDLKLYGSTFKGQSAHCLVSFDLARVGGDLLMYPPPKEYFAGQRALISDGPIEIDGATIQGRVDASDCVVGAGSLGVREAAAFSATNASIGFDMVFHNFAGEGRVDLSGTVIGRRLEVSLVSSASPVTRTMRVEWDLRGASARILSDGGGAGWDVTGGKPGTLPVQANFDGFTYEAIENLAAERLQDRIHWLDCHIADQTFPPAGEGRWAWLRWGARSRKAYSSQPYLQLASVYRKAGRDADADEILRQKMRRDGRISVWPKKGLWSLFDIAFGFGFQPRNTIWTLAVCILAGAAATKWANANGMLVIDATPVAAVASFDAREPVVPIASNGKVKAQLPCGGAIDPILYAIDVFVPLIDLRQENKCEPSASDGARRKDDSSSPDFLHYASFWGAAKAIYAVLGWVLMSLALLTFSGILRRQAEKG